MKASVLLLSIFLTLPLAAEEPYSTTAATAYPGVNARPLSASDMADAAGVFYGKIIQVRSDVRRSYDRHAFTVTDEPLLAAPEVLILVPEGLAPATEGYTILATGTARPFRRAQLERDFPWFRASLFGGKRVVDDWVKSDMPVLVAHSVRTERGLELARSRVEPVAVGRPALNVVGGGRSSEPPPPVDDLGVVFRANDTLKFAGNPVTLKSISVWRVLAPDFITVGSDPEHQILVHVPEPRPNLTVGDTVALLGSFRPLLDTAGVFDPAAGPERVYIQADYLERITH